MLRDIFAEPTAPDSFPASIQPKCDIFAEATSPPALLVSSSPEPEFDIFAEATLPMTSTSTATKSKQLPFPKKRQLLDLGNVAKALTSTCCEEKQCLKWFSPGQLETIRKSWIDLGSTRAQHQFLFNFVTSSRHEDGTIRYHLGDGREVCREAFLVAYGKNQGGLCDKTLDKIRHEAGFVRKIQVHVPGPVPPLLDPSPRPSPQEDLCYQWFQEYIRTLDRESFSEKTGRRFVHLPSRLQWHQLYDEFVEDKRKQLSLSQVPSWSVWDNVRLKEFSFLRPSAKEYGVCTTCTELSGQMKSDDPVEVEAAKKEKKVHRYVAKVERQEFESAIQWARSHPEDLHLLAVDQSLSRYLPRLSPPPTKLVRQHRLELRVGGGIDFSADNNHILFFSLASFPKDTNLILTQLWSMIVAAKGSARPVSQARRLRVQMDNCAAENKNQVNESSHRQTMKMDKKENQILNQCNSTDISKGRRKPCSFFVVIGRCRMLFLVGLWVLIIIRKLN